MARFNQFLSDIRHEIRTPINGVLGMLQLLQHTTLDEKQEHYVKRSMECAESLLQIVDDLLDFTKMDAGHVEIEKTNFQLKNEFEAIFNIFNEQAKTKTINMELHVDDKIPTNLIGDKVKIKKIINYLLRSALKSTPDEGYIALIVTQLGTLQHKHMGTIHNQIKIQFSIINSGVAGSGLAVTLSKQLVEKLGGMLKVESVEGESSTSSFILDFDQSLNNSLPSTVLLGNYISHADVLLVEDNETNQIIVKEFLQKLGCHIEIAGSGKSALLAAKKRNYDLILMDCQLPDMDGYTTTKFLRKMERKRDSPKSQIIVALTADTISGTKDRCLKAGMDDYLTKPVTLDQLEKILKQYVPAPPN